MDFDSTERLALKNYLEHYGVKGQKWGVRKFQDEKSSSRRTQSIRNVGTNIVEGTTSASAPKFKGRNSNRSNSLVSNLVAS